MLLETLKRHWWVPVLRGVAAIIFGVIAFTHPVMAAATLVLFFGAWVLIDGIFRVIGAIGHRASDKEWGFDLIIGLVGIIIGLLTFHAPQITALALIIYIAAWALMIEQRKSPRQSSCAGKSKANGSSFSWDCYQSLLRPCSCGIRSPVLRR